MRNLFTLNILYVPRVQVGCFDENATQFYSAEIVVALEYLHNIGIIHRSVSIQLRLSCTVYIWLCLVLRLGLPEQVGFGSRRLNFHLATGTKELFVILLVLIINARHFVALYFFDCHSLYMYI